MLIKFSSQVLNSKERFLLKERWTFLSNQTEFSFLLVNIFFSWLHCQGKMDLIILSYQTELLILLMDCLFLASLPGRIHLISHLDYTNTWYDGKQNH